MRISRRLKVATLVLLAALVLYLAGAALLLRFGMDRVLFPRVAEFSGPVAESTVSIRADSGGQLLVRRYGQALLGCVVFFPGQHGASAGYSFEAYVAAGLAVHSLAYPGQDGASGPAGLAGMERLVGRAVHRIGESCPSDRTIFVGVSLGSMLAAYAAQSSRPAGLVLVSAAPSLSSAIRVRLHSHLMLAPMGWLPLSRLLPHDYSLAEGLAGSPDLPVVIFQGMHDDQTPIQLLQDSGVESTQIRLVGVPGADHSTAFRLSLEPQISAILEMLKAGSRGDT